MMRLFICCMLFLFFSIIILISKDWDLPEEEKNIEYNNLFNNFIFNNI